MLRRLATRPVAVFGVIALLGVGAVLVFKSGIDLGGGGSGDIAARVHTPAPFAALTVDGPLKVTLGEGEPQVRLEGGDDLLRYVTIAAEGEELVIQFAGDGTQDKALTATVQGRGINRLKVDGAAVFEAASGLAADLELSASGATAVALSGTCETLVLDLRQAARAALGDFDCRSVEATLDHAAWAEVSARDRLKANVGGVAELIYRGKSAKLLTETSAEGRIHAATP